MILDEFLFNMLNKYQNLAIVIPLFIYLSIASFIDVKKMIIPNKLNLIAFIYFAIYYTYLASTNQNFSIWSHIISAIVAFLILFIPAYIKLQPMGGDIKCFTVIGFIVGMPIVFIFLLITIIIFLIYGLIKLLIFKEMRNFPLAPFFLLAQLILFFISIVLV